MIQNGGELHGRRYLEPGTVELMRTNQLAPAAGWVRFGEEVRDGFGYGYGFNVVVEPSEWDPDARPGEFGWGGKCSCHYWMHPEEGLIVITLEQTLPYSWVLERALKAPVYEWMDSAP
jgi:CubicO group peptidase (beta-lactamase class C family)